jgi:hypothetical protein
MNFISNFSPEEILRKKELESEFEYDEPVSDDRELSTEIPIHSGSEIIKTETEAPKLNVTGSNPEFIANQQANPYEKSPVTKGEAENQPTSLGKSQKMSTESIASNLGWKNIPTSFLPSGGMFYPEASKIAIRAAEVKEIRHYSTIDDDDKLDIEEKLSYILERCCRTDFPGEETSSYKDLKQEDRFFIIMAIRDLTFTKGENMIILKPYKKCKSLPDCPFSAGIELRTGVLSSYDIDPEILRYYDTSRRCFVFNPKKIDKKIEMYIPSIGVTRELTNFIREAPKRGIEVDDGFISVAPFLFNNWRELTFERILGKMREIDNFWSKEEYSLYFELSERIKIGTNLEVKLECPVCGEKEVTASITFPRGLRSLFVISDIFRELL